MNSDFIEKNPPHGLYRGMAVQRCFPELLVTKTATGASFGGGGVYP
jgi:hypothetical protein